MNHGTLTAYNHHGCRCDECREANTVWARERRARRHAEVDRLRKERVEIERERASAEDEIIALSDEVARLREAGLVLAAWMHHLPRCDRRTSAGDCSCGLDEAWAEFDRVDASDDKREGS